MKLIAKIRSTNRVSLLRYATAVLAGLLLTAAFPKWNLAGAAWIGPGIMLLSALGASDKQAWRLGFVAGLAHALSALYWLLLIPYTFHGIPFGPGAGWLSLSAYVALYPALWVWICWKIFPREDRRQPAALRDVGKADWAQRTRWCLQCAILWVGLEIIRATFLTGFPWLLLGSSQSKLLPLIQIASIGGVYIISFLVVWTAVAIAVALAGMAADGSTTDTSRLSVLAGARAGSLMRDVFLPLFMVGVVVSFGISRAFHPTPTSRELKIALIQPSIPQTVIWNPDSDADRFQKVLQLSEQALATKPDVLIWPESAFPQVTAENYAALIRLVTRHHVWMIFSADDVDAPATPDGTPKYYNASFLISPDGQFINRYRKKRLVIFGEYIPLVRWLPFLKWFTPIDGGFTPGTGPVQFNIGNPPVRASVLICFEDMFPHEAREHVGPDTDFLLNLTNDGWFGESAQQWQQADAALFRAVENGVPLVRCTNNGITCWIDAQGRIRQIGNPQNVYGTGHMTVTLPLPAVGTRQQTFYNRHGDWFGWSCAVATGFIVALEFWRTRRSRGVAQPRTSTPDPARS